MGYSVAHFYLTLPKSYQKEKNCKLALTDISVNQGIAVLGKDSAFSLGRLDTNDLPKAANAETSDWTRGIVLD